MAKILPFRAILFDRERVGGSLDPVVTQPYDRIDEALQEKYYARHPKNAVRLTRGKDEPDDSETRNKYTRAAETLNAWLAEGTLVRDAEPALYACTQTYRTPAGATKTRKGLVALGVLEDLGKGGVHAHERTLLKPKQDRLSLMRATGGATFGHVFMLYSDPTMAVNRLLDGAAKRPPDLEAKDDFGETHRAWRITDKTTIATLQREMARQEVYIADGHHRYETALTYRDEMRKKGAKYDGPETADARMMTFVNMEDEGLTIFPTHRLIHDLPEFSLPDFLAGLSANFRLHTYPFADAAEEARARLELLEDLHVGGLADHAFGIIVADVSSYYLATLRENLSLERYAKEKMSAEARRLDVNILQVMILEPLLSVTREQIEREEHVSYCRHAAEAIEAVQKGRAQLAFIMSPTKIRQVREIAGKGERMPQKSTDFYPKLLSGFIMNRCAFAAPKKREGAGGKR